MNKQIPVKKRLGEKLDKTDYKFVRSGLVDYFAQTGKDPAFTPNDVTILSLILPVIQQTPSNWDSLLPKDLNTSHQAIKNMYDCIRGQLGNLTRLRPAIEVAKAQLESDDEVLSNEAEAPSKAQKTENSSQVAPALAKQSKAANEPAHTAFSNFKGSPPVEFQVIKPKLITKSDVPNMDD